MKFSAWWAQQREREYEEKRMPRTIRDEDSDGADTVSFEAVRALRATDKALLCNIGGEEKWVPRSQVHANSDIYENSHSGTLVVTHWWAEKAELA